MAGHIVVGKFELFHVKQCKPFDLGKLSKTSEAKYVSRETLRQTHYASSNKNIEIKKLYDIFDRHVRSPYGNHEIRRKDSQKT